MKKLFLVKFVIIFSLLLSGCWSYVGLDEIVIISGIAVDKEDDNYILTFEMLDISNVDDEGGVIPKLIEGKGPTIYEAVQNASVVASKDLCFCSVQAIIINKVIAKEEGIKRILDFFLRNRRIRELSKVVISGEETAKQILEAKGIVESIISIEIMSIIEKAEKTNLQTLKSELYNIVNVLEGEGIELVLPVFRTTQIEDEVIKLDELATFKGDKLNNYMPIEETKYFLFVIDKVKGGVISFQNKNQDFDNMAFNIYKSKTSVTYEEKEGDLKFHLHIKLKGSLEEYNDSQGTITIEEMDDASQKLAIELKKRVSNVILKIQRSDDGDIIGFGKQIYQRNPKLWRTLKKEWPVTFKNIKFDVKVEVLIANTGLLE